MSVIIAIEMCKFYTVG